MARKEFHAGLAGPWREDGWHRLRPVGCRVRHLPEGERYELLSPPTAGPCARAFRREMRRFLWRDAAGDPAAGDPRPRWPGMSPQKWADEIAP